MTEGQAADKGPARQGKMAEEEVEKTIEAAQKLGVEVDEADAALRRRM
jgi:DNA-binding transcriptional regulator YhcF (GntR family)